MWLFVGGTIGLLYMVSSFGTGISMLRCSEKSSLAKPVHKSSIYGALDDLVYLVLWPNRAFTNVRCSHFSCIAPAVVNLYVEPSRRSEWVVNCVRYVIFGLYWLLKAFKESDVKLRYGLSLEHESNFMKIATQGFR